MSLKGDKYETVEEVTTRLKDSVVMYDGKPVYITRISYAEPDDEDAVSRVFFRELPFGIEGPGGKEVRKYLSSKKFDLATPRLGYFNNKGEAVFVSRTPVRQYQQGLTKKTASLYDCHGKPVRNLDFSGMVKSQGFVDMINGKYPSFQEVGDMIEDKDNSSVALSASFAFRVDHDLDALILLHKGTRCGLALKGDKALKIPQKFHFLRQEMEECRIPLA